MTKRDYTPQRYQPPKWPNKGGQGKSSAGEGMDDFVVFQPSPDLHFDSVEGLLQYLRENRCEPVALDLNRPLVVGLHRPAPHPAPQRQAEKAEIDIEAKARREAFLMAAEYHEEIMRTWDEARDLAKAEYDATRDERDLKKWETASANAANHYDFANDMRRLAEGTQTRNSSFEFNATTQIGTWPGRLKKVAKAEQADDAKG